MGREFQHFVEQAPVTVAMFDRDMRYMAASPRWLSEHKLDSPVAGQKLGDGDPLQPRLVDFERCALAGECVACPDHHCLMPDGSFRWRRMQMRPWRRMNDEIGGVVIFIEDIDDAAHRRLVESALSRLAHELRNPLATINLTIEMLEAGASDGVERQALTRARRQGRRLVRMIDDLAEVSSHIQGKIRLRKERIDLALLLPEMAERIAARVAEKAARLALNLPEAPLPVFADRARLEQIFLGLLDNALKFSKAGARIDIEALASGADVIVTVGDEGVGIAREQLAEIFEFFHNTEPAKAHKPNGLGVTLALARRLLVLHGGWLEADSDGPDKGSKFILRLPLHIARPAP